MRYAVFLVPALILVACSAPLPMPSVLTASHPAVGEQGWIYAELKSGGVAKSINVAATAAEYTALRKALNAKDDVGVRNLLLTTRYPEAAIGTRVLVIDTAHTLVDLVEVRFIDGEWARTTGWTEQYWVVSRLPDGFTPVPAPAPAPITR